MPSQLKLKNLNLCQKTGKWRRKMKAMGKVTLTLGLMIIVSLFLTSCSGVVTPEISMGSSNNPSSNNPNSNNYQDPSTDPVEELVTEEQTTNPNSNNYQDPSTDPVEESVTEESEIEEGDTTKPVITASRAPLPNSLGWNNTDVTVSFSCEDVGPVQSGIETNTVAGKTVTTEGKGQLVTNTGTCIDAAGNVADMVTVSNINIDKTAPVVTITLPGTGEEYVLNQSVTATWSATDALSGVVSPASGSVSIDTSSVGTKTFTLPAGTVKDKAGNSSLKITKSYSVIVATEEPVIEEPNTIYPQKWATGIGTAGDPWEGSCIEDAYTACPAGGTIYLRAGYYQLDDNDGNFTISKAINIIGEGRDKTFVVTADDYGFHVNADYVTIKNLTVDGAAQTPHGPESYCFAIAGCDYITLDTIEVKNCGRIGINILNVNHSLFQDIYVHDSISHGLHPGASSEGRHQYNTFRNIYSWDNATNGFDDFSSAVAGNNTYDNINCWDNGGCGIAIFKQVGVTLSNSTAIDNGGPGIYLSELEDSTINDCLAEGNGTLSYHGGIKFEPGLKNVNFTNVISKNNAAGPGAYIADADDIRFTSCQLYDDRETPLQTYGMELYTNCTGISLLNCKLSPNKDGEIYNPNGAVVTVITEKMLAKF